MTGGITSSGVVGQWGPTGPQSVQAIASVIGYSPELDGVILMLKPPHTGNIWRKQAGSDSSSTLLSRFQRHLKKGKLAYGFLGLRKTDMGEQNFLISDVETNSHIYVSHKITHVESLPQVSHH